MNGWKRKSAPARAFLIVVFSLCVLTILPPKARAESEEEIQAQKADLFVDELIGHLKKIYGETDSITRHILEKTLKRRQPYHHRNELLDLYHEVLRDITQSGKDVEKFVAATRDLYRTQSPTFEELKAGVTAAGSTNSLSDPFQPNQAFFFHQHLDAQAPHRLKLVLPLMEALPKTLSSTQRMAIWSNTFPLLANPFQGLTDKAYFLRVYNAILGQFRGEEQALTDWTRQTMSLYRSYHPTTNEIVMSAIAIRLPIPDSIWASSLRGATSSAGDEVPTHYVHQFRFLEMQIAHSGPEDNSAVKAGELALALKQQISERADQREAVFYSSSAHYKPFEEEFRDSESRLRPAFRARIKQNPPSETSPTFAADVLQVLSQMKELGMDDGDRADFLQDRLRVAASVKDYLLIHDTLKVQAPNGKEIALRVARERVDTIASWQLGVERVRELYGGEKINPEHITKMGNPVWFVALVKDGLEHFAWDSQRKLKDFFAQGLDRFFASSPKFGHLLQLRHLLSDRPVPAARERVERETLASMMKESSGETAGVGLIKSRFLRIADLELRRGFRNDNESAAVFQGILRLGKDTRALLYPDIPDDGEYLAAVYTDLVRFGEKMKLPPPSNLWGEALQKHYPGVGVEHRLVSLISDLPLERFPDRKQAYRRVGYFKPEVPGDREKMHAAFLDLVAKDLTAVAPSVPHWEGWGDLPEEYITAQATLPTLHDILQDSALARHTFYPTIASDGAFLATVLETLGREKAIPVPKVIDYLLEIRQKFPSADTDRAVHESIGRLPLSPEFTPKQKFIRLAHFHPRAEEAFPEQEARREAETKLFLEAASEHLERLFDDNLKGTLVSSLRLFWDITKEFREIHYPQATDEVDYAMRLVSDIQRKGVRQVPLRWPIWLSWAAALPATKAAGDDLLRLLPIGGEPTPEAFVRIATFTPSGRDAARRSFLEFVLKKIESDPSAQSLADLAELTKPGRHAHYPEARTAGESMALMIRDALEVEETKLSEQMRWATTVKRAYPEPAVVTVMDEVLLKTPLTAGPRRAWDPHVLMDRAAVYPPGRMLAKREALNAFLDEAIKMLAAEKEQHVDSFLRSASVARSVHFPEATSSMDFLASLLREMSRLDDSDSKRSYSPEQKQQAQGQIVKHLTTHAKRSPAAVAILNETAATFGLISAMKREIKLAAEAIGRAAVEPCNEMKYLYQVEEPKQ